MADLGGWEHSELGLYFPSSVRERTCGTAIVPGPGGQRPSPGARVGPGRARWGPGHPTGSPPTEGATDRPDALVARASRPNPATHRPGATARRAHTRELPR